MKILYIYLESKKNIGVRKKISYQIKALKKIGNNVDEIYADSNKAFLNDEELFFVGGKILKRFLIFERLKKINLEKYDVIYIRNPGSTFSFLNFLKKNKSKKLILEIPTYPYDKECNNFFLLCQNILDKIFRKELYKYIDKIITYSEDKEIFGIPCINISNGIDLEETKMIAKKKENNKIVFTSVSNCSFWHGIDRFLYSLIEYIKQNETENIIFNIVGEGSETKKLKEIVKENIELEKITKFHGIKVKEELEKIYNETDVAIGSLGRHRSGINIIKTLKNREYAAKGLPMIFSENDLDFGGKDFVYKVKSNESIINIFEIIEWYKKLKITSEEIREYSERFSWDIQMKKVVDEINKD